MLRLVSRLIRKVHRKHELRRAHEPREKTTPDVMLDHARAITQLPRVLEARGRAILKTKRLPHMAHEQREP